MLSSLTSGTADLRAKIALAHVKLLRRISGGKPFPLWYWSFSRRLAAIFDSAPDGLFPPAASLLSRGEFIQVEELRKLLDGDILGEWSLDADTITLLWEILQREKPRLMVECGAGMSTLVLARYAATAFSKDDPCFVVSLEQDVAVSRAVDARLRGANLDRFVRVVHSPLDTNGNYGLEGFERALAGMHRDADFLLIDGPAGVSGCRLATLPALRDYCVEGTRWVLDDAFRDGELRILAEWSRLPGVQVEGIYPVGKGLGGGWVRPLNRLD